MATISPPKPGNRILIGGIWGVVAGVITLLIALLLFVLIGTISTYTSSATLADETIGGLFIIAFFACGIAVVPAMGVGGIVGVVLALMAQRRGTSSNGWLPGVAIGILLYALVIGVTVLGAGSSLMDITRMQISEWAVLLLGFIPTAFVFGGLSALIYRRAGRP